MLSRISILVFLFMFLSLQSELKAQLSVIASDSLTLITVSEIKTETVYPDLNQTMLDTEVTTLSKLSIDKDHVYNTHFGFFCKQEAKRDKKSKVPVRLRLGTLDQVNRKEYGQ